MTGTELGIEYLTDNGEYEDGLVASLLSDGFIIYRDGEEYEATVGELLYPLSDYPEDDYDDSNDYDDNYDYEDFYRDDEYEDWEVNFR